MRNVRTMKVNAVACRHPRRKTFDAVVKAVPARVGARRINVTPISIFSKHHFAVLKRIRAGSLEVVTDHGEPFIILGMNQILALVAGQNAGQTTARILAGRLPHSASPSISRHNFVRIRSSTRVAIKRWRGPRPLANPPSNSPAF